MFLSLSKCFKELREGREGEGRPLLKNDSQLKFSRENIPSATQKLLRFFFFFCPCQKVEFCQLKDALEIDWNSEKAKAALKKTPADYFLLQVIMKFRTDKGRDPQPGSFQGDCEVLLQIRNDQLDSMGVNPDLLAEDFASVIKKFKAHGTVANLPRCGRKRKIDKRFQRKIVRMLDKEPRLTSKQVQAALQSEGTTVSTRTIHRHLNEKGLYALHTVISPDDNNTVRRHVSYCFSEMAPVCAVVGGVLGQEVVKALSQRDPPHNNFFFFDGLKSSGIVDCLGAKW
ncbi:unnamed protein product [Ranitomeya imitator]|uniref:Transposase Tc1-like domain-containing protein n=1 Tax=Ranitomeya imitator TaxID=111125 RepID=A0ABN9LSU8_9NEOB|nr:unnamed protein product [Ranitomeya imitator]